MADVPRFGAMGAGNAEDVDLQPLVRRFRAEPRQVGVVRRAVKAYASEHGATDPDGVALAVSEAVTNAVLHAYVDAAEPGEIEVVAERMCDDGLRIVVSDDGRGMRPRPDSPGIGVGLPLVATVADSFEVETRAGGGTRMYMRFDVA